MAKTESEAKLQNRMQRIIREHGCYVFKNHGNMYCEAGRPDLVACVPTKVETLEKMIDEGWFKDSFVGVFMSIEVKRENRLNELSDAQRIVGANINKAGGLWFALDESDTVTAIIKKLTGEIE